MDIRKISVGINVYMYVMLTKGSLRYVCGQIINPTVMAYTFLESPAYLDMHPEKPFALFGRNRRNLCRRTRHKKQRNLLFAAELFTMFSTFIPSFYTSHVT